MILYLFLTPTRVRKGSGYVIEKLYIRVHSLSSITSKVYISFSLTQFHRKKIVNITFGLSIKMIFSLCVYTKFNNNKVFIDREVKLKDVCVCVFFF